MVYQNYNVLLCLTIQHSCCCQEANLNTMVLPVHFCQEQLEILPHYTEMFLALTGAQERLTFVCICMFVRLVQVFQEQSIFINMALWQIYSSSLRQSFRGFQGVFYQ